MAGGIIDLSALPPPADLLADVCIIGSGCGGATAAAVLAEAGREVVVLEEGGDYTGLALTQRDAEMYDRLYADRGGRATDDLAIAILQGRVLGGSAVINACDVVPLPDGVLTHWQRRFGLVELGPEALRPHAERVLADLSASRIEEEELNRANRLFRAGAQALGLRGEVMLHNRVDCAGLGTCLIGCPLDAKQSPRAVAIPRAIAAGARFYIRARAFRLEREADELKRIIALTLDPLGHRVAGSFALRARHVIVAASAIGTAELLLRSGIGNAHVGRHLILQPQLPVMALFPEPIHAYRGIPQAYALTEFERTDHPEHGLWGFRLEPVMGTPGMVGSLAPASGYEGKALMARFPHFAACLCLVPDAPSGVVSLRASGRRSIRYDHRADHLERVRQAAKVAARVYLAAGAGEVIVPVAPPLRITREADLAGIDRLAFAPATAPFLSAHQQGTARLSASPRHGAVDPTGQVWGTRGVYVMDASLFPSSASTHTMAPVMTVARYLAAGLAGGR